MKNDLSIDFDILFTITRTTKKLSGHEKLALLNILGKSKNLFIDKCEQLQKSLKENERQIDENNNSDGSYMKSKELLKENLKLVAKIELICELMPSLKERFA